MTDCSTVRRMTREERTVKTKVDKLTVFERKLDEMLGGFKDDTARLLRDRELPENHKPPKEWVPAPDHPDGKIKERLTESGEQEIMKDDSLISTEILFPNRDGSQHMKGHRKKEGLGWKPPEKKE